MNVNWSASEIGLTLSPVGKPLGRKPRHMSVFKEYGDMKTRFVQALAGMLDGETVYIESVKDGTATKTVPVAGWRRSEIESAMSNVITFIDSALRCNMSVVCYGASRARWELTVKTGQMAVDETDNLTDKGSVAIPAPSAIEPNGIRRDF